jgi:hypothetical protein
MIQVAVSTSCALIGFEKRSQASNSKLVLEYCHLPDSSSVTHPFEDGFIISTTTRQHAQHLMLAGFLTHNTRPATRIFTRPHTTTLRALPFLPNATRAFSSSSSCMSWLWTFGSVPEVDASELLSISKAAQAGSSEVLIVDVRTAGEFDAGHGEQQEAVHACSACCCRRWR